MKLEKTSTSSDGLFRSPETQSPRFATEADEDFVIELAKKFLAASPYNAVELNEDAVRSLFKQLRVSGCVLVNDGGFIAGMLTPLFFSPDVMIATELAWWAPDANGTELREGFEQWAKDNGAQAVQMSTLNNAFASRLAGNLTSAGYTPIEVGYLKAL